MLTAASDGVNRNCNPPVDSPRTVKFTRRDLVGLLLLQAWVAWHSREKEQVGEGKGRREKWVEFGCKWGPRGISHCSTLKSPECLRKKKGWYRARPSWVSCGAWAPHGATAEGESGPYKCSKPGMQLISSCPPPQLSVTLKQPLSHSLKDIRSRLGEVCL